MADTWDNTTAEGKRLFAELEALANKEIFVGFQSGKVTDDNGVDIANIAAFNELGTSRAPARPFLRKSVDENGERIQTACAAFAKQVVDGGTAETALKGLGVFAKTLVQQKITDGDYEPNAPSTIKAKGSDKPLIDTGRMRQSVEYIIREKGSGE